MRHPLAEQANGARRLIGLKVQARRIAIVTVCNAEECASAQEDRT
jgi:hypothetical protein